MTRDPASLGRGPFDLLVIGGGIYGSWIAYDAALRGLHVALVEKTDWGAGASSASSKLIHGGLRYLEQFHIGLVRTSLAERKRLAALAPHRISPLRFIVPVYRGARIGRFRLKLGLTLYDLLAGGGQPVARHRSIGRKALLLNAPFLADQGLRAGFSYGDCSTDDARYALEVVDGALRAGAVAVNHAEVLRLLEPDGRVEGAVVRERETGETVEMAARLTVDCSGAWSGGGATHTTIARELTRLTKGVHLVMPPLPSRDAFLLTVPADGRAFFLIPWYGRTLLGTTDTPFDGNPDDLRVKREDVAYLLEAANRYLARPWTPADVLGSYVGLRTLQNQPDSSPSSITREWSLEEPLPGLMMPIGGKYTSARADAAEAVDRVFEFLERPLVRCQTEDRPFPWAPADSFPRWFDNAVNEGVAIGLDPETAHASAVRFGSRVTVLHALVRDRRHLGARLHPELPFSLAEVVYAVDHEMARTLEDILRRRIPLLILARGDADRFAVAAELAGERLGWSNDKRQQEVASLLALAHRALPPEPVG